MLSVENLSKSYGPDVLFEEATFRLGRGERTGLVGPNGAGKTTLVNIILGRIEADSGSVQLERGARVGFLPQESAPAGEETLIQLTAAISPGFEAVYETFRQYPDPGSPEHQEATAHFTELEGFQVEARAKRILASLAFRESDLDQPARQLSGGWIMRAHLARLLTLEPEVLILDEPTNHLDLETLGWFQNHLQRYPGTLLAISHDRNFLNTVCTHVVEISRRRVIRYTGNFDSYLEQRHARQEQHRAAWRNQQREIAHLESFIERFRAKASKATQAQARIKQLEKMERIEAPESPEATVAFRFPEPPRSGQRVARLEEVRQAYGNHLVYESLDLLVERGQRTVLVGPNGAGKSTLLKILAGLVPIQDGLRELGQNVTLGYFSQQRTEVLDTSQTVLEEATSGVRGVTEVEVRRLLGSFLFRGDDVFKSVSVLSGGEKSRLALVKLLLHPPNLLLLDEPTTHLDMASIDALIGALKPYTGTLLFVSHDVHFIRALASSVLQVQTGQVRYYPGDYDYYLFKSGSGSAEVGLVAGLNNARPHEGAAALNGARGAPDGGPNRKDQRRAEARQRQEESRRRRELERRATDLEAEIIALEEKQEALNGALADSGVYNDPEKARELNAEANRISQALSRANREWEAAAETLAALDPGTLSGN